MSILGRAKRFAKIAGEMISLSAVEEAVSGLNGGVAAVVSRPHPTKGEELVRLHLGCGALTPGSRPGGRARQGSFRTPERSPKHLRVCAPFPLLGSGKPDLVALQQLAEAAAA